MQAVQNAVVMSRRIADALGRNQQIADAAVPAAVLGAVELVQLDELPE